MSIRQRVLELEGLGHLVRFKPVLRKPLKRRLFLTRGATHDFNDPYSATNVLCGRGHIANAMTRWVAGDLVYGSEKRGLFLDRLDPPPEEIWEMRVTTPRPQARLFGRFAEQDTLILSKFHSRGFLGNKGSANWNDAMATCHTNWASLFPDHAPLIAPTIDAYVSENCDDFPI